MARNAASRGRAWSMAESPPEGKAATVVSESAVGFSYPRFEGEPEEHDAEGSSVLERDAASAIRELVERLFAVPPNHRSDIHVLVYQRVCALGLVLLSDGEIVETLSPGVVAKRLGMAKQTVGENMAQFIKRLGMFDSYQRRRHADMGHNKSRRMAACDKRQFLARLEPSAPSGVRRGGGKRVASVGGAEERPCGGAQKRRAAGGRGKESFIFNTKRGGVSQHRVVFPETSNRLGGQR